MAEATKPQEPKVSKDRSPSFPFIPLATAIERLEAFEKKFGRHPAPAGKVGLAWDMKEKSSQADQTLAALKSDMRTIFEASGHNIAWDIVSRLNGRISRLRVMTLSTTNRTTSGPAQIRKIFAAIERNDPEAAAEACRAHVAAAAAIAETLLRDKAANETL